jgi:hypothetical protein
MNRSSLTALLALLLALPLATACKDSATKASAATTAVQTAARQGTADTARVTLDLRATHPEAGEFLAVSARGALDFKASASRLTVGSDPPVEQVYVGGNSYQAWPGSPYWLVAADEPGPLLGLNPVTILAQLARAHGVQHLGAETLDGARADHYRYSITIADLPENLRPALRGMTGTVDVWISNGRVHRVITTQQFGDDAHGDLAGQQIVTEVRLSDWGLEVEIAPPDPSLIKTFEELTRPTP